METSLTIDITKQDSVVSSYWLNMEQEHVSSITEETSLADLNAMMNLVRGGETATKYIMDNCSYVVVIDGQIIVTLPFYVWPYSMEMPYTLSSDIGEISDPERTLFTRSADVIFNNDTSVNLGYIFDGDFTPSMPFLLPNGEKVDASEVTTIGGIAHIDKNGYCVYRANGEAEGYQHNIIMTFDKLDENGDPNTISSLDNNIFAKWTDEQGEIQTTAISLKIPQCVADALVTCLDGTFLYDRIKCAEQYCNGKPVFKVYYNTCKEDDVIGGAWTVNK